MSELSQQLSSFPEKEAKLQIERELALQKALTSTDVNAIYKAKQMLEQDQTKYKGDGDVKSILIDPMDMSSSFGYKNKPFNISYQLLRAMSRTHIVKSIIETRKEQVVSYCQPQKNKYSTGFVIKKRSTLPNAKDKKLTKEEEKIVTKIVDFLMFCGQKDRLWHADTFDTFTRKVISDSLTFDQCTFEVVRDNGGNLFEMVAVDASTIRIADSYDDESYKGEERVKKQGYYPSYVQVIDSRPSNEYYPWDLCFGIRNPSTDITTNGYGRAELEDMIQTVTSIINSDFYNANFFKVGSAPKGILSYAGNINENSLQDFRRQWMSQTAGVMNMHKIPIINADKITFTPTHVPNKDMEFSKFQEFLIKISCAVYKIDPAEIGFPMSGAADGNNGLGGDNSEEKIKTSKDKGLTPLLKQYQYWLNKYIVWQIHPDFEIEFQGINGEMSFEEELDADIKSVQNFMTGNEVREKRGLKPIPGFDIILNPIAFQAAQAQQQQDMMQQQQEQGGGMEEQEEGYPGQDEQEEQQADNPFLKAELEQILTKIIKN
jgi:hypothetical protein